MAVFLINVCKFNDCGLIFQSLGDLIQHIEENHIDYDPLVIQQKEQQQPQYLPLSYILRFFTDDVRKETDDVKPKIISVCKPSSITSQIVTPNGSDVDDDDDMVSEFEDSNDSWTTSEEFSSEFILRHGSKMVTNAPNSNSMLNNDKPFACPVPGCKKRYKNVNGIKYHSKNGHKNDGRVRKAYKCHCGKSYKTGSGLKNHTATVHTSSSVTTVTTQGSDLVHVPSSQMTTLQPIRALTLKHIANLGLPLKTLVVTTKSPVDKIVKPSTSVTTHASHTDMSSLGILTPAASPSNSSSASPPLPQNASPESHSQIAYPSQSISD